jgi:hypothetical protein
VHFFAGLERWSPALHDPGRVDLAISGLWLAVVGLLAWSALRRGLNLRQRIRWAAVGAVVAALLVNQQGDFHVHLIDAAAAEFQSAGLSIRDPLVADAARAGFAAFTAAAALLLLLLGSRGRAPGRWGSLGLLLLLGHGVGRAMTFAHLVEGPLDVPDLHQWLKAVQVVGLLLLAVGAWRWGKARARSVEGAAVDSAPARAAAAS